MQHDEHGPAQPGDTMDRAASADVDSAVIIGDTPAPAVVLTMPTDAKARKNAPMARGVLDYFPRALAAVANLSRVGNDQHNPGQPMHWAKHKSTDHADCIMRHLADRGTIDVDGVQHSAKVAWRALANLEIELQAVEGDAEALRQVREFGTDAHKKLLGLA